MSELKPAKKVEDLPRGDFIARSAEGSRTAGKAPPYLALACSHEHEWNRYILRNVNDQTEKVYTELEFEDVPDAYFIGFDCEGCGDDGFLLP